MMGGTRQNMPKVHELGKPDLYKKKSVITRDIRQNIFKVCKLEKLILLQKKFTMKKDTRKNIP